MFKIPDLPGGAAHRTLILRVLWGTLASQTLFYAALALLVKPPPLPVPVPQLGGAAPFVALLSAAIALALAWFLGERYAPRPDPATRVLPSTAWKKLQTGVVTLGMIAEMPAVLGLTFHFMGLPLRPFFTFIAASFLVHAFAFFRMQAWIAAAESADSTP